MDEKNDNVQEIRVEVEQQNAQNFFLKLVETIKQYGIIRTACAVGLFQLVMSLILHPLDINQLVKDALAEADRSKAEQHDEGIRNREKQNELIPMILDNIRGSNRADRVMLMEFHNGGTNVAGLPFVKFTQTFESVNTNRQDYVSDHYQAQNIGNYPYLFNEMVKNGYLYRGKITKEDITHKILSRQEKNGVKSIYIRQLYGKNGGMIGFFAIDSYKENAFDEATITMGTIKAQHQLEALLSY